jgi:hypothetical protein
MNKAVAASAEERKLCAFKLHQFNPISFTLLKIKCIPENMVTLLVQASAKF